MFDSTVNPTPENIYDKDVKQDNHGYCLTCIILHFNLIIYAFFLTALSNHFCTVFPCTRVSNLLVEHASVEGDFNARSKTVGEWLDTIKMGRYTELFMEGGYSSLETVAQMTSE